jgi:hypothetical protein
MDDDHGACASQARGIGLGERPVQDTLQWIETLI